MGVEFVNDGTFRLTEGESPREVAEKVYGDSSRYQILLKYNDNWDTLDTVIVPNKRGRMDVVHPEDTIKSLIKRMFPNQPVHLYEFRYMIWNAGLLPEDLVGCKVFIPER